MELWKTVLIVSVTLAVAAVVVAAILVQLNGVGADTGTELQKHNDDRNASQPLKTILLFGIRRSGNHFLLSTILQHFESDKKNSCVHMNDVSLSFKKYQHFKTKRVTRTRIDRGYTGFAGAKCVILSMENKPIDMAEIAKFKTHTPDCHVILLIRNPYDNLSSAWKIYFKMHSVMKKMVALWREYSAMYLDTSESTESFVRVLYDNFVSSSHYREAVIQKLGITPIGENNLDLEKSITWQTSSFNSSDKAKGRRVFSTADTCNFCHVDRFRQLFNDNKFTDSRWKAIQEQDGVFGN